METTFMKNDGDVYRPEKDHQDDRTKEKNEDQTWSVERKQKTHSKDQMLNSDNQIKPEISQFVETLSIPFNGLKTGRK